MKRGMKKKRKKREREKFDTGKCQDGQRWIPDKHPCLEALSHT